MNKIILTILIYLVSACRNIPSDPDKTFEEASDSHLLAGYSVNPPWTKGDSSLLKGPEEFIIRKFAEDNNMVIVWHEGSEQELLRDLEEKKLHLVISGIRKDTPWKNKKIGLTMPYFKGNKDKRVIAVRQGENKFVKELEKVIYQYRDTVKRLINASEQKL